MRSLVAASAGVAVATGHHARAQALPALLKGHWVFADGDCKAGFTLRLNGSVLRWTDAAGHADTQRVTSRRPTGIATRTTTSTHGQPAGKAWVYEVLAPGQISLTEASTGRSTNMARCPDMLPANATPRQMVEAIYARYAASDEPNLPLSNDTNIQAFFVADLAAKIMAFSAYSGHLADGCNPQDPFVPGFYGDYKVIRLRIDAPPNPDRADHATIHVSFRDFGKPAEVSVLLDRTPAGWRIGDVSPTPGQSFKANMAACPDAAR